MRLVVTALSAVLLLAPAADATGITSWHLDWRSAGHVTGPPFAWDITGRSLATLARRPDLDGDASAIHASGPVWELRFTHGGRTFGGLLAEGSYQLPSSGGFEVPAPDSLGSMGGLTFGLFDVRDGSFASDALVGFGNNQAAWMATAVRAPEPGMLALCAMGLAAASLWGRRRRR